MPAVTLLTEEAADLADLLRGLRDWVDAEEHHLEPLLDRHGYHLIGLRVALDRYACLLATNTDDTPPF